MGANLASIDAMLKDDYKEPLREALNSRTLLLSRLQRNTDDVRGRKAVLAVNQGRNEGIGARAENADLPSAGQQSYDDLEFRMTYHYGRIEFSGPSVQAAADDEGAFTRVIDSETRGLVRDILKDTNRQLFGDGSGILAKRVSGGAAAATTIVVDDVRRLGKDMKIDFVESTGGTAEFTGTSIPAALTNNSALTISAINRATKTVTLSSAIGTNTTANTILVRSGAGSREMYGLDAIFKHNAGAANVNIGRGVPNFGGLDSSSAANEWYQPNIMVNPAGAGTLRPFSTDLLDEALDIVDIESNGEISIFITNHAIYRRYAKTLLPDRRYQTQGEKFSKLDGGYDALEYDGIPMVKDKDCQDNRIYGLDEMTIMLFEQSDWDWMDKDGAILKNVPNKDAYEAILFKYMNLGCDLRRNNVLIADVAHS